MPLRFPQDPPTTPTHCNQRPGRVPRVRADPGGVRPSAVGIPPQGCIRREGTSGVAPEAVRQAVGGGCQSGWMQLLSVTNAIETGTWRPGDRGWALAGRLGGGGGGTSPPSNASLPPLVPLAAPGRAVVYDCGHCVAGHVTDQPRGGGVKAGGGAPPVHCRTVHTDKHSL